jgi:hypothetical protein
MIEKNRYPKEKEKKKKGKFFEIGRKEKDSKENDFFSFCADLEQVEAVELRLPCLYAQDAYE